MKVTYYAKYRRCKVGLRTGKGKQGITDHELIPKAIDDQDAMEKARQLVASKKRVGGLSLPELLGVVKKTTEFIPA